MTVAQEIEVCLEQIKVLRENLESRQPDPDDSPLHTAGHEAGLTPAEHIKARRYLNGHFGKIYAHDWSPDSRHITSASQDGKLIVWNGFTTNKQHCVNLQSSWVMACAYSQSGNMVSCGGLDNVCSVYKIPPNKDGEMKICMELAQHDGYLSCCRFDNEDQLITSSGDATCILWDVETKRPKATFAEHAGDVMSVDVFGGNVFVSGSCDTTAKLWDVRQSKASIRTFYGHVADVNSVRFFPSGNCVATGSDDAYCRLFDIRAYGHLARFAHPDIQSGVTSMDFSKAGKLLFAAHDDFNAYCWDTQLGKVVHVLKGHDNRVACLRVAPDGKALCTSSWDQSLQIWA